NSTSIQKTEYEKDLRYNPNSGGKVLFECKFETIEYDILYVHFYEYRTPIEEFMRSLDE
ncbi:16818_t:CDS:2, partial [Rhizophagus irregularis]